jgi:type II secretory pathway pseudopilin PulG
MILRSACSKLFVLTTNRNGFTFLVAIYLVMIVGILSAFTGKSWSLIMKREREKELIFRGSQIKEAIENWYNPKGKNHKPIPLTDLKYLLDDPTSLTHFRYLPQSYATKLDDKNSKCAPDCATLKIYQDPMTGKEWTYIRGTINGETIVLAPEGSVGGGIVGIASKSEDEPLKTDFKDTALENMGSIITAAPVGGKAGTLPTSVSPAEADKSVKLPGGAGGTMTKYSEWKFMYESPQKNDHSKIYRAYHERW